MKSLKKLPVFIILAFLFIQLKGQKTDANVFGDVQSDGEHIPFVGVFIEGTSIGTTTDATGHYMLINLPEGTHVLVARYLGYETAKKIIKVVRDRSQEVNFELKGKVMTLKDVVITGTKTIKRQTDSPVIVNILEAKIMDFVEASSISEGLRFQSGLRVETDCQTCNYTQLRINGLSGSYSQILINGRPIFSPLLGLYGLEQIPANMIERIEVVKGAGSSLYGSNAIGGTVNIITRIPKEDSYDFNMTSQLINGRTADYIIDGSINVLTQKRNGGASIFITRRSRDPYDHNSDNFSEIPEIANNSFGANIFLRPYQNQKLELSLTSLNEYRYGGEITDEPAYLALQSEERTHNVLMGSLDYQIRFNEDKSSLTAYFAGQSTNRRHYTGNLPDDPDKLLSHINEPPYGYTTNLTVQTGTQINHHFKKFPGINNMMTIGFEYVYDKVSDSISAYNYGINQVSSNIGTFVQSDWEIFPGFIFLAGLRADKHNLVDNMIVNPRLSLLYKFREYTQFRLSWGTGFRAPQSFDTDMHIAFAGGGVSRISLSPDLSWERSNSLSGSVNYDKTSKNYIVGFTIGAFYTKMKDAFFLQPMGEDNFGYLYEKRNGDGATVMGITIDLRGNYRKILQLETGLTLQVSLYDKAVENIAGLAPIRRFLRTPERYGYTVFSVTAGSKFSASLSTIYTGPMLLAHFAGAPEIVTDTYKTSSSFFELNFRAEYTKPLESINSAIGIFCGIKNITNEYQNDFDTGKDRDSNYIYGPSFPRIFYFGLKLKSI